MPRMMHPPKGMPKVKKASGLTSSSTSSALAGDEKTRPGMSVTNAALDEDCLLAAGADKTAIIHCSLKGHLLCKTIHYIAVSILDTSLLILSE